MLPETLDAWKLFVQCRHQMHTVSAGFEMIETGLNYTGVKVVLELLYPPQDHKALFERLLIIEDEYLAIKSENRE